jgi:ABC-type nitrate/sulfonate/bicarbonate transport system permease component
MNFFAGLVIGLALGVAGGLLIGYYKKVDAFVKRITNKITK